jgi:hypothetical protein
MGVLLRAEYEEEEFAKAKEHAELLISSSQPRKTENASVKEQTKAHASVTNSPESAVNGFCIRGGEIIPLDTTHPLCLKHYNVWKEHSDPEYKEKYCHMCGKLYKTSLSKPLCLSCFKKNIL